MTPDPNEANAGRIHALREWFEHLVESDFSEDECRSALKDLATVLPAEWLEEEHVHLYGKPFDP